MLLHELRAFFVEHGAMFDGVDPSADGSLDSGGSLGVCHHFLSSTVSDLNCHRHLRLAQLLDVEVGDGIHDTASRHQLDPVGTVLDVATHHVGNVIDSVGNIFAARQLDVGREGRAVAVSPGDGNTTTGSGDARAEDEAALDGITQSELRVVVRAFAGIAD